MNNYRILSEYESKEILRGAGISTCKEILARDLKEVLDAVSQIGYPVALKGCMEGLAHKSEENLVFLDVKSNNELEAAYKHIKEKVPEAKILVQEMVNNKREVLVGFLRDEIMGPCVSFGLGGIFTEILKDVAFRLAPVNMDEAKMMLDDIRGHRILDNIRGLPAVDKGALAELIVKVSILGITNEKIREIDINPVCFNDKGIPMAVDATVILK